MGDNERLCAMEVRLRLQRCSLQASLDPEPTRSAGQCLTKGDGILKIQGEFTSLTLYVLESHRTTDS